MIAQEIYDKVRKHLLTQNEKAIDPSSGHCRYKTNNGLKCAIGCLIVDSTYKIGMEGKNAVSIVSDFCLLYLLPENLSHESGHLFLNGLQSIHDSYKCELWESELDAFRIEWDLNLPNNCLDNDLSRLDDDGAPHE